MTFSGLVVSEFGAYDLTATASNNVPWQGTLTVTGADLIFYDGFESGGTSAW